MSAPAPLARCIAQWLAERGCGGHHFWVTRDVIWHECFWCGKLRLALGQELPE